MRTCCPRCATCYEVDTETLLAADGLARCFHCHTVFDAIGEASAEAQDGAVVDGARVVRLEADDELANKPRSSDERELPFDVPDDLEPLQPSKDGAIDIVDTLYEKRSPWRVVSALLVFVLLCALALQIAWQQRDALFERFPQLERICEHVECRPPLVHQPDAFRVLRRDMQPTSNEPGSLTLSATVRNEAEIAQRLPDIQLSLLDNNGSVLIRRRLAPRDYQYPPPPEGSLVGPGEVFTIALDFADPGYLATGFVIDFL